jgi:hypothetical protein
MTLDPRATSEPAEFDCIDCGLHVFAFGRPPSTKDRCAGCQWLAEIPDTDHRAVLRAQLVERAVIGAPAP